MERIRGHGLAISLRARAQVAAVCIGSYGICHNYVLTCLRTELKRKLLM